MAESETWPIIVDHADGGLIAYIRCMQLDHDQP